MQKYSQEQGTVVGGQREKIYNGKMGDKRFGDESGGPDSTVEIYMSKESEEGGVTVLRPRGQLQLLELPRVLNLDKESFEHLRWTHLEQVQHCTDLPRQVTFPAHTEQGKMGPGLG